MQTTAFLGVAHIHTPGFISMIKNRADISVKAVYELQSERGERRADELQSVFTSDLDAILKDEEITSVIVCSETVYHRELVTRAAAAGKHLFVEKPLAVSAEDADAMQAAIEDAGVLFQTGFFMRSSPQSQFLKREVASGNLGTITRMRHTNCHEGALAGWFDDEWNWIADKNLAGGGGFADLGAHSLDIILWTLRGVCGEVKNVAASLGTATKRHGEIDEYGSGIITFESGAIAAIEASWVDPKLRSPIEVHGTHGEIIIEGEKVRYYSEKVEGADGGIWTDLPKAAPHAFDLFWDKLEGKEIGVDLIGAEEAAEGSRVMAAMYKAAGQ